MIHDKECIGCQYLFTCTGKPEEVKKCIKLKERESREQQTSKDAEATAEGEQLRLHKRW